MNYFARNDSLSIFLHISPVLCKFLQKEEPEEEDENSLGALSSLLTFFKTVKLTCKASSVLSLSGSKPKAVLISPPPCILPLDQE